MSRPKPVTGPRASITLMLASLLFFGCATTRITQSWRNPDVAAPPVFKKIAVVAFAKDEATRRIAEDEFAKSIGEARAIRSYMLISKEELADPKQVQEKVKQAGADGMITITPVDIRKEMNYVPGSVPMVYHSPWTYSAAVTGRVYDPGYVETNTIVQLETNIYSLQDEKLIWSGSSETMNPGKVSDEVKQLAKAIRERLKKDKLLP